METLKKKLLELKDNLKEVMDEALINAPFWTKERPRFGVTHREDCIILTSTWWDGAQTWEYEAYEIVYDGYWRCLELNGDEAMDIADLKADYYITLPKVTRS